MPCSDGGPSYESELEEAGIRASWCAVFRYLESRAMLEDVLDSCDWKEAGVSKKEVLSFWNKHKRKDRERREREEKLRKRNRLISRAKAKLTPEELEALRGS